MTGATNVTSKTQGSSTLRRYLHPGIAAVVLLLAVGWWLYAKEALQWALRKEPVPWPAGVEVDEKFRLLNFPVEIGPFRRAEDGDLPWTGPKDGQPDGENVLPTDILEPLGVGIGRDGARRQQRRRLAGQNSIHVRPKVFIRPQGNGRFEVPVVPNTIKPVIPTEGRFFVRLDQLRQQPLLHAACIPVRSQKALHLA